MENNTRLEALFAKKINLLVVDDYADVRDFLVDLFSSPCISVVTASSYVEACAAISRHKGPWHTWLLDIDLGSLKTGIDIIKENPRFPFVLILSGLQSMSAASEALHCGAMKAFDKFQGSITDLVAEFVEVASLAFLLKGKYTKYLPVFSLLRDPCVTTARRWADEAFITTRQLSRICELHGPLTPCQCIAMFNACRFLLKRSLKSLETAEPERENGFVVECVAFVEEHDWELLECVQM
jgi:CheY-like chemotaxis protein